MAKSDLDTSKVTERLLARFASEANTIYAILTFYLYTSISLVVLCFLSILAILCYPIALASTVFGFCYATAHQWKDLLQCVQLVFTRGSSLLWNVNGLQTLSRLTKPFFYCQIGICEWWHKHIVLFSWVADTTGQKIFHLQAWTFWTKHMRIFEGWSHSNSWIA